MDMKLLNTISKILVEQTSDVPLIFPATKWYPGGRYGEVRKKKDGSTRVHYANDIGFPVGTPLFAPHSGYVTTKPNASTCGYMLIIGKTTDNYYSKFCHLLGFAVSNGQWVNAGELVGYSGGASGEFGAGNSTGAHLHWEFKVKGATKDPYKGYLDKSRLAESLEESEVNVYL